MASRHIAASTKRPKTDKKGRGAGYMMVDSKSKYAVCRIWGRWTVLLVKLLTDHVSGHSLVDSVFSIALNDTQKISSSNFAPSCQSLGQQLFISDFTSAQKENLCKSHFNVRTVPQVYGPLQSCTEVYLFQITQPNNPLLIENSTLKYEQGIANF